MQTLYRLLMLLREWVVCKIIMLRDLLSANCVKIMKLRMFIETKWGWCDLWCWWKDHHKHNYKHNNQQTHYSRHTCTVQYTHTVTNTNKQHPHPCDTHKQTTHPPSHKTLLAWLYKSVILSTSEKEEIPEQVFVEMERYLEITMIIMILITNDYGCSVLQLKILC